MALRGAPRPIGPPRCHSATDDKRSARLCDAPGAHSEDGPAQLDPGIQAKKRFAPWKSDKTKENGECRVAAAGSQCSSAGTWASSEWHEAALRARVGRYVRRGPSLNRQVDVGRSLAADWRSKSKTVAKKGEGDRGDQKRR
jgi:hypothetical protein